MSKSMMSRLLGFSMLLMGAFTSHRPVQSQPPPDGEGSKFPKACYFFKPRWMKVPGQVVGPPSYNSSVLDVYRYWCTASGENIESRRKAADAMVATWKRVWNEDTPYDTTFHEIGAFDLLVLTSITHELPGPMADDPTLTKTWIESCSDNCFHLGGNPLDLSDGRFMLMQLWLRNDVLDNLKKDPATEPVLKMLMDAKFTLVN